MTTFPILGAAYTLQCKKGCHTWRKIVLNISLSEWKVLHSNGISNYLTTLVERQEDFTGTYSEPSQTFKM